MGCSVKSLESQQVLKGRFLQLIDFESSATIYCCEKFFRPFNFVKLLLLLGRVVLVTGCDTGIGHEVNSQSSRQ